MPGSNSKQEAERKDVKATSPAQPMKPKPILKEPSFGLPPKEKATPPDVAPETVSDADSGVEPPMNTPKMPAADHVEDSQIAEKQAANPTTTVQS